MTHLLDTDHVSFWQRQDSPHYAAILSHLADHRDIDVGVSVVSLNEQSLGCNKLIKSSDPVEVLYGYDLLYRVIHAFRTFRLVAYDAQALDACDSLRSLKIRISTPDLRIAAIAKAHNLTLVTRNLSDFGKVPGLKIEDWTK